MRSMRVYNRRIYRNTILFGAALLACAVALVIVQTVLPTLLPGWTAPLLWLATAVLFFFGAAYIVAGLYGLAKVRR